MLIACISRRAKRFDVGAELPVLRDRETLARVLVFFGTKLVREASDPTVIAVFRLAISEVTHAPEVARALDSIARERSRGTLRKIMARAQASGLLTGRPAELAKQFAGLLWRDLQVSLLLGAYSVRPVPDARVSAPLRWSEVSGCDPAEFTLFTMPKRFAEIGDPHAGMNEVPGSLESLLELAARDEAEGLGDAPWPPHFRKMESEGPRVAPSRAKSKPKSSRIKVPLIVVANSPDKGAALAGLERWKARHDAVVGFLAPEDVLVDSMRGRSSTWTRIRVNLQHVPESLRPAQENPDPDDDPTRQWRAWSKEQSRTRKQNNKS
jgi:hypothetical protein